MKEYEKERLNVSLVGSKCKFAKSSRTCILPSYVFESNNAFLTHTTRLCKQPQAHSRQTFWRHKLRCANFRGIGGWLKSYRPNFVRVRVRTRSHRTQILVHTQALLSLSDSLVFNEEIFYMTRYSYPYLTIMSSTLITIILYNLI